MRSSISLDRVAFLAGQRVAQRLGALAGLAAMRLVDQDREFAAPWPDSSFRWSVREFLNSGDDDARAALDAPL